jgi:glycosyltransferase involved in cell wall biosynthesis
MPGEIALGVFIVEALAAGVPVVQPDQGGFSEVVTETGGGVLYSPTTAEALTEALASLLSDTQKRQRLARRGREAVRERFNHRTMAQAALDALSRGSRPNTRNT